MFSWLMEKIIFTIGFIGMTVYCSVSMLVTLYITFFTVVGVMLYYPFLLLNHKLFKKANNV